MPNTRVMRLLLVRQRSSRSRCQRSGAGARGACGGVGTQRDSCGGGPRPRGEGWRPVPGRGYELDGTVAHRGSQHPRALGITRAHVLSRACIVAVAISVLAPCKIAQTPPLNQGKRGRLSGTNEKQMRSNYKYTCPIIRRSRQSHSRDRIPLRLRNALGLLRTVLSHFTSAPQDPNKGCDFPQPTTPLHRVGSGAGGGAMKDPLAGH